jgi:hypothetical protein
MYNNRILIYASYNSAVFSSTSVNDYAVLSVSQSFVDNVDCVNCTNIAEQESSYSRLADTVRMMQAKAHRKELDNLTKLECIEQYAEMLQTKRRNVLLVASDDKFPPPALSRFKGASIYAYSSSAAMVASDNSMAGGVYSKLLRIRAHSDWKDLENNDDSGCQRLEISIDIR